MKTKLTLFIAVLAIGLQQGYAQEKAKIGPFLLKKGLVAYYPFNGNSLDESGNGNHGGVSGASLSTDRHGNKQLAYSFDGKDDYIQIVPKKGLENINALTVSLWIRADQKQISPETGWTAIINWWIGYNTRPDYKYSFWLGLHGHANNFVSYVAPNNSEACIVQDSLRTNIWMHVIYSHGSSGAALYFDGKRAQTNKGAPIKLPNLDIPLHIGATSRGGTNYKQQFSGSIDDVRIYNRALSDEEVKALYDLEKPKAK